jgi:dihydroorotate dehydrogenase
MYSWLRKGLFQLPPETAHELALESMKFGGHFGVPRMFAGARVESPVNLMGLEFPNAVGLAAGMDKNGDYIDALGQLGFGHLELGTVTPRAQPGNPKPRSFRIKAANAAINRMGFNNHGVDHLVERLKNHRYDGIVGANIGKQKDTSLDEAVDDYLTCLRKVHPYCDYVAVNVSSPNTADLRELQDSGRLRDLLGALVAERESLKADSGEHRPLVVKIAPDWDEPALTETLETIAAAGIDGLVSTNTTIDRSAVTGLPHADEKGGLSGAPLLEPSNRVTTIARDVLGEGFPIIGSGGIMTAEDAASKIRAGADLVQLYTGFIYNGPALVQACARAVDEVHADAE